MSKPYFDWSAKRGELVPSCEEAKTYLSRHTVETMNIHKEAGMAVICKGCNRVHWAVYYIEAFGTVDTWGQVGEAMGEAVERANVGAGKAC